MALIDNSIELFQIENRISWFSNALHTLNVAESPGWPDIFGDRIRQWGKQNLKLPVTAISLFSGAGGLDIGFRDAGFSILECNEIEPLFAATLKSNIAQGHYLENTDVICQDIRQYCPSVKTVDFIIGGPPCQTFSAAGARAAGVNGTDDERGNLFLQYARIINELQPKGFLFENVYRIVGAQSGKPWGKIQSVFQELGYKLFWRILDAADYGVPQFRERLIIVGVINGGFLFPEPSHGPDSIDKRSYYTAKQAVSGIDTSFSKIGIGGRHGHLLYDIPPGLNYSFYTEKMGHPKPIFGWRSKFSDYLYKADPETPVRTIKAQGGQYTGPFSWENRQFTVDEYKRLQTFPDSYIIEGSKQNIIHQLGNSVPPQLARILALSILQQLFNVQLPFSIPTIPENYQLGFRKRKSNLTTVYAHKAKDAISNIQNKISMSTEDFNEVSYITVNTDFHIHNSTDNIGAYKVIVNLNSKELKIELYDTCDIINKFAYQISITPPSITYSANNSIQSIRLVSYSSKINSITAIWKILEQLLHKHNLKDDLVQLFGYYQNKNNYKIQMDIHNDLSAPLWIVIKKITEGACVGAITYISDLSYTFTVPENILFEILKQMKDIGYEIRSCRTNKQIPKEMILIPYSFPTLNERSLQRLTRL